MSRRQLEPLGKPRVTFILVPSVGHIAHTSKVQRQVLAFRMRVVLDMALDLL